MKLEAEEIGYEGQDVAKYVKRQQSLDREEGAAWREAQKVAEIQAKEKKKANEIQIQMTPIAADRARDHDKEPNLKDMELQARSNGHPGKCQQVYHRRSSEEGFYCEEIL